MLLLDLENCDAGYCPTQWQWGTLPDTYQPKVEVIFDGIDTSVWSRHEGIERRIGDRVVGPETRIVTYVARGFESIRGFDIFLKVARRIYRAMPDVLFVVVGEDRVAYGGDKKYTGIESFRDYAFQQDDYDLSKFLFTGRVAPGQLARWLSLGDAHLYLTIPFVLSWSLFNALSCGATVVASRTAPVCELIEHGKNGLLADFYDVEGLAEQVLHVLRSPLEHRRLGRAGMELIRDSYAVGKTLPQMLSLYRRVLGRDLRSSANRHPVPMGSGPASAQVGA
jgi:glycosyltransferase involved in cell wall biosynthesis